MSADRKVTIIYIICLYIYRCVTDCKVTLIYIICLYIYRYPLIVMLLLYKLNIYIFVDVEIYE